MLSLGTPASFAFRMATAKRLLSSGFADPPAMSQWLGESRRAVWAWTTALWLQIEYPMAENEPPRTEKKKNHVSSAYTGGFAIDSRLFSVF